MLYTVGRGLTGTHYRDHRLPFKIWQDTLIVQHQRRVMDIAQPAGIGCVMESQDTDVLFGTGFQNILGLNQLLVAKCLDHIRGHIGDMVKSICMEYIFRVRKML